MQIMTKFAKRDLPHIRCSASSENQNNLMDRKLQFGIIMFLKTVSYGIFGSWDQMCVLTKKVCFKNKSGSNLLYVYSNVLEKTKKINSV